MVMVVTSTVAVGWISMVMLAVGPEATEAPAPPVLTGSADVGFYAGQQPEQDAVVASPRLQVGIRARPEVELGLSMGAVSLTAQHREHGRVRAQGPSNFVFGTRWVRDAPDARHHGHLGFAFALPLAFDPTQEVLDAHRLARASRGGLDPWEWSPATMGVIIPAGWSMSPGADGRFDVGVDGAFGGMFSAGGDLEDPGFVGQVRAKAGMKIWRAQIGAAVAAVYNGREELGALQTAVQPFVAIALCRAERLNGCGVHLDAGASVNIDAPYGFGPDGRRIWGTQFGLRWALRDAPTSG